MNEDEVQSLEASLTDEERELLDELADGIAKRRLTPAAIFFFESVKPLGFIGSQMLQFFRPLVEIVWNDPVRYRRLTEILEKRGSVELLVRRLEARA